MEPSAESPSPPSVTGSREEAGVRLLPSLGARKTVKVSELCGFDDDDTSWRLLSHAFPFNI